MQPYVLVLAQTSHEGAKYVRRAKLPRGRWRVVAKASSIRGIRKADVHCLPGFHKRPDRHAILGELRYAQCQWFDVEMPPPGEAPARDQGDGMGQQLTIEDVIAREDGPRFTRPGLVVVEPDLEPVGYDGQGAPLYEYQLGDRGDDLSGRWSDGVYTRVIAERYNRVRDALNGEIDALIELENVADDSRMTDVIVDKVEFNQDSVEMLEGTPKARRRRKCADCGTLHFKDEPCTRIDGVEETPVADLATMFD